MLQHVSTEFQENPLIDKYVIGGLAIILSIVVVVAALVWFFNLIESIYVDYIGGKPLFRHFYFRIRDLSPKQKHILDTEFRFYKSLNSKEQRYFRHRVHKFLSTTEFIGKEDLVITEQQRVLISATAIMLTFGYRDYAIKLVDKILVYPSSFYSNLDKAHHKGHFNPGFKAVIFSWEDFLIGYKIEDDNINLGIHEFIHAIHLSALKTGYKNSVSSYLFLSGLQEVTDFINADSNYKNKIKQSEYFRDYAFTNDFEFIAVLIENFIETPKAFKSQFPEIYNKVKRMLNFNFSGY